VAQARPGAKFPAVTPPPVSTAVEVRVRYSETDRMGVAHHAHCRVERADALAAMRPPVAPPDP